jgi:predicted alpha/beta superfamily hydrolase
MGHVHILRDFHSLPEGFTRTLRIYTPDAYDARPHERFGVLYMHDGQNVFAHPESARFDTWCANHALEQVMAEGSVGPWIIVGVDSGPGRLHEFSPFDEPRAGVQARAEPYARFLVEHLKPWVDRVYRTRPDAPSTAVAGSSLGGLVSLWLGLTRPDVFGRVGAFSPTVMWSERQLWRHWREHTRRWSRIYLDAGEHEFVHVGGQDLDYGPATRDFHAHLRSLGYGDHELRLVLEPGGAHFEDAWQRRLPDALRWLLA